MASTKRARDKRGRFIKSSRRRRKNPPSRRTTARKRRRSSSRRTTRRNPPNDLVGRLTDGLMGGLSISAAQGITRALPGMLKLPQAGPIGLAISTATAVTLGMIADTMFDERTAAWVTSAALSVPMQAAALQYVAPRAPIVATMFVPTLGAYPSRRALLPAPAMSAYPRRALPAGSTSSSPRGFRYASGFAGYDYASGVM